VRAGDGGQAHVEDDLGALLAFDDEHQPVGR